MTGHEPDSGHRTVRRRAVTAGLAWAVPVVVVGAAAPAYAASACPALTYALDDSHSTFDQILIRNAGATPLPAGRTITWVVQNRTTAAATLAVVGVVGVTASPTSVGITAGGRATLTFTLTAPLAPGATLSWSYTITGWNYASRVTVNGCTGATACLSSNLYTPGTACPTAGPAAAPAAADGQPVVFPDPGVVPPK